MIHLPQRDEHSSWTAWEELYKEGRVKAIGVNNFNMDQISGLIKRYSVIPVVNQVETHPFSQKTEMQKALKAQGIHLESWAPFAQGKNKLFNKELLKKLSNRYNKTIAQVVFRWLIQREVVVIPKSANVGRIDEHFNVFDFDLSADDMIAIKSLDKVRGLIYNV